MMTDNLSKERLPLERDIPDHGAYVPDTNSHPRSSQEQGPDGNDQGTVRHQDHPSSLGHAMTVVRDKTLAVNEIPQDQAALSALEIHTGRNVGPVQEAGESFLGLDSTPGLADEEAWSLSGQILCRLEQSVRFAGLQEEITVLKTSVESTSVSDEEYATQMANLGVASFWKFRRLGELSDLDQAVTSFRDAARLIPNDPSTKSRRLSNLGDSFLARFECLGELSDLTRAISSFEDAVNLIPDGHPSKHVCLNSLGRSLLARFQRLEELSDLERAIVIFGDAVNLTSDSHPDKAGCLINLGNLHRVRFNYFGKMDDLEYTNLVLRDAANLFPDDHPEKPMCLQNLGNSFLARFERVGESGDLDEAISRLRDALELTPDGHPDRPCGLCGLGNSFLARFEHLGEPEDLEKAISIHKEAVSLTLNGHPAKPSRLASLGDSLLARFERFGELGDLYQAISTYKDALDSTPDPHPCNRDCLAKLGNSLRARFRRLGELSDLQQAISKNRDALNLTPDGHPERPSRLDDLGRSSFALFEHLGQPSDLEQAVSSHRDAVSLTPDDHPKKPSYLSHLGNSFFIRFEHLGHLSDLEQAISSYKDAVNLTPDGSPHKHSHLGNLGSSIRARFDRLGNPDDLQQAISNHKAAFDHAPDGHPDKPGHLNDMGSSFLGRFVRFGELSDLQEAIVKYRDAVSLTPNHHPSKPRRLGNLGNSLLTRFEDLGDLGDLQEGIAVYTDAVDLTPHGHPRRPTHLCDLGVAFVTRFEHFGDLVDLEQAISKCKDAADLTPDGHPDKPANLSDLGSCLLARFAKLQERCDLEEAMSVYCRAACGFGPTIVRFQASQRWISCARDLGHQSLLEAYSVAISLLPQLAWIGLPLTQRYHELTRGANVVREAAATALDSGHLETAVEWLEQGRSIIWGEVSQLRGSYEELSSVYPDHAHRLRRLSTALERASAIREKSMSSTSGKTAKPASLEQEADRHRMLAIERDELLEEIRGFPGFERFLLHKEFSQLRASAHSGPVVVINAAKNRCDALIVLGDAENVVHVPLPDFKLGRSRGLQNAVKQLVGHAREVVESDERAGKSAAGELINWEPVLSALWSGVVKPVLDALNLSTSGDLSRVFWCPTGPFTFLPIHAAGLYGAPYSGPGHKAFDFVISSYVPTLSILLPQMNPKADTDAGADTVSSRPTDLRLLLVRQPSTDGFPRLPGVDIELETIRSVIANHQNPSAPTTLLESPLSTVEQVLELMRDANWVHFACHGVQDAKRPTESGLCLANGRRLKLSDIIALSRPRGGGLAFLSACQTATGDEGLSDEALHVAAGMLLAGYGAVIGTMWSISDRVAPRVARDVYQQLFQSGSTGVSGPDHREAARALHDAVGRLRDDQGVSFAEWLPFIHVGL